MFSEEKTRINPEQMKKVGMENGSVDGYCEFSSAELAECESELRRLQIFAKEFHILPGKLTSKLLL